MCAKTPKGKIQKGKYLTGKLKGDIMEE